MAAGGSRKHLARKGWNETEFQSCINATKFYDNLLYLTKKKFTYHKNYQILTKVSSDVASKGKLISVDSKQRVTQIPDRRGPYLHDIFKLISFPLCARQQLFKRLALVVQMQDLSRTRLPFCLFICYSRFLELPPFSHLLYRQCNGKPAQ